MLILTDFTAIGLLQAAEAICAHELVGKDLWTKESDGELHSLIIPWTIVDVPMALSLDPEVLEKVIDEFLKSSIPEIIITVSQVPPWNKRGVNRLLSELESAIQVITDMEEQFGRGFKISWFAVEGHPVISRLVKKFNQTVVLKTNIISQRLSTPEGIATHRNDLDLIEEYFTTHQLYMQPVDDVLKELMEKLVASVKIREARS